MIDEGGSLGERETASAVASRRARKAPAPKRQRLGRDERRRQLVEATVRLIGESGIRGTTMSRISAELGLSEMAVYRHFANKDELLMEADSYVIGRILEWFASSSNPVITERLREIGETHFDSLSADIDMFTAPYMQFLTMSQGAGPLHERVIANNLLMKETLESIVREGIEQGSIRADVDAYLFTHEFVGWFLAEDIHCLADLRDGTFSRSSHLRTLELILKDVAS
jgi:AcrR family transcriptional regulator